MINLIKKYLEEEKKEKIDLVKFRGGSDKILFFVFLNKSLFPSSCLKTTGFEDKNYLIEKEFNNLKKVFELLPDENKKCVPLLKKIFKIEGRIFSEEEAINGEQILSNSSNDILKKIVDLLVIFHKSFLDENIIIDRDFIENALLAYGKKIDFLKKEPVFKESIKKFIDEKLRQDIKIFSSKQHGDFHFGNIFLRDRNLVVVDWSNFGKIILPGYDLSFFLRRQKGGLLKNKDIFFDYCRQFSIPENILSSWIEILFVFEGFEKWLNDGGLISTETMEKYFSKNFIWARK